MTDQPVLSTVQMIGLRTALVEFIRAESTFKTVCGELGLDASRVAFDQSGNVVLTNQPLPNEAATELYDDMGTANIPSTNGVTA